MQNVARGMSTCDERVCLQAGGVLDGDDALIRGLVRERGAGNEIADRIHALPRGSLGAVHLHEPPLVQLDAGVGQAEPLDVGAAPGGDHQIVDLRSGRLGRAVAAGRAVGEAHARLARLHVGDRRAGVHVDALLLESPFDETRDVGVLGRQHAIERLEQQHLAAQAREAGGDLRAGGPGADDGQAGRQL